jgi:ubiquinone/menaquinone biosynthesis C-methylase UbiE
MQNDIHICNEKHSWALDNGFRRLVQSPYKILRSHIKPGMKAVDLGCGPGYFTLPMAQLTGDTGSVTAVDVQAGMLVRIKNKIKGSLLEEHVVLHQCTEDGIGLSGTFDFALAFWMVHEVPYPDKFIGEVYQLIKPNGYFLLVEPKGHVGKEAFENTVAMALTKGFRMDSQPQVRFSRAVKLIK